METLLKVDICLKRSYVAVNIREFYERSISCLHGKITATLLPKRMYASVELKHLFARTFNKWTIVLTIKVLNNISRRDLIN